MREFFLLASRIIGLCLVCWGLVTLVNHVPYLLNSPGGALFNQHFKTIGDEIWKGVLMMMLTQGCFPIALGIYLMFSNNLFVQLCYGAEKIIPSVQVPELSIEEKPELEKIEDTKPSRPIESDESRFAPPGMKS